MNTIQESGEISLDRRRFLGTAALAVAAAELGMIARKARSSPVPTITLEGDANGAPHPDPVSYARKFSGRYSHRLITGGIGHNLPQEAPQAFAEAVIEAGGQERSAR